MRSTDLESKLKCYIIEKYEVEYNKDLPIEVEGTNYICTFYLGNDWRRPLIIQGDFDNDDDFYTFICKEFDSRRLYTVWFSRLEKQLDSVYGEEQINKQSNKWTI